MDFNLGVTASPLLHSENVESLPKRLFREKDLVIWRLPSFSPNCSWTFFRKTGNKSWYVGKTEPEKAIDRFWVRRLVEDDKSSGIADGARFKPTLIASEASLPQEVYENIFELLHAISINPMPDFRLHSTIMYIDGISYGIMRNRSMEPIMISWHEGDNAYGELLRAVKRIIEIADSYLPASTLKYSI